MDMEPITYVSEVKKGQNVSIVWHIKGWKTLNPESLKSLARCTLEVPHHNGKSTEICFSLQDHVKRTLEGNRIVGGPVKKVYYLSLCMSVSQMSTPPFAVNLSVGAPTDESGQMFGSSFQLTTTIKSVNDQPTVMKKEFILLKTEYFEWFTKMLLNSHSHINSDQLKVKISMASFQFSGGIASLELECREKFCEDFKKMYINDDNLADLKLETKDGMLLSAHKFVLAARSPVLRAMIMEEVKKEGFTGTLKMSRINAKPMMTILHWIYTGEIREEVGLCMDEVVEAVLSFELGDMFKMLDKEMITVCNPENMMSLFQVAKRNGMPTAMVKLSSFVKTNIGSIVPETNL